jgi:hypothetical protein
MLSHIDTNGLILLALGLLIRYQIGRCRFNRRSLAGVQMYRSYFQGLITSVLEVIFNFLAGISIAVGIIVMIVNY